MENLSLLNIALIVFSLCLFGLVAWTGARNFDLQIDADIANGKISLLEQSVKRHQDARNKNVLRLFQVREDLMRAANCAHEHAILEENLYARLHSAQMELRECRRQLGEAAGKQILLSADLAAAKSVCEKQSIDFTALLNDFNTRGNELVRQDKEILAMKIALEREQKKFLRAVYDVCAICDVPVTACSEFCSLHQCAHEWKQDAGKFVCQVCNIVTGYPAVPVRDSEEYTGADTRLHTEN